MIRKINRMLNIRSSEWPRLSLLLLILFFIVAGNTWGQVTAYAGFVSVVGADRVPLFLALGAVLAIVSTAVYAPFADRIANDTLFIALLILCVTMMGGSLLLLQQGQSLLGYTILYLMYNIIVLRVLFVHLWQYLNGFYDTQTAKRIVPLVAVSARLAGALGLLMPFLNSHLTPEEIILIWMGTFVLAMGLIWALPLFLRESRQKFAPVAAAEAVSYGQGLRQGFEYTLQSPFMRWMALSALVATVLLQLHFMVSTDILEANLAPGGVLADASSISSLLGRLIGVANLVLIPIQLVLLPGTIRRIGLGNANLLYPLMTLAISVGLAYLVAVPDAAPETAAPETAALWLTGGAVLLAFLANLNNGLFRSSFQAPIDNLLYNAAPLRFKGRARAFVNGIVVPLAILLSSGLLLALRNTAVALVLVVTLVGLALAYVAATWIIRKQYSQALIDLLDHEDFASLMAQDVQELTITDASMLNWLAEKLAQSESAEMTLFMARLLSQLGGAQAVPILAQTAQGQDAHVRAAILDILAATAVQGNEVRHLYTDSLQDPQPEVRAAALRGLRQVSGARDTEFLALAVRFLEDADVQVRGEVLPVLLAATNETYHTAALTALDALLHSTVDEERVLAVRVLGQGERPELAPRLLPLLDDPADGVRLEAMAAVELLTRRFVAGDTAVALTAVAERHLKDPVQRVRELCLVVLGRVGGSRRYELICRAFDDGSLVVRDTAVAVLADLGKGAIPTVHPMLDAPNALVRKTAAVALARINAREYAPLIAMHMQSNLLQVYKLVGQGQALGVLKNMAGVAILQEMLQQQRRQLVDELFYLLTAVQDAHDVRVIQESLVSADGRQRANAAEALESITTPQMAQLVAPLFNPQATDTYLMRVAMTTWEMQPTDLAATMQEMVITKEDSWFRTVAVYALGEVGHSLYWGATASETTAAPTAAKPDAAKLEAPPAADAPPVRRRRAPADLLDVLAGDAAKPPADEPTAEPPTAVADDDARDRRRRERRQRADNLIQILGGDEAKPVEAEPPVSTADKETVYYAPAPVRKAIDLPTIEQLLQMAQVDPDADVQMAARRAQGMMLGKAKEKEGTMLSIIERIIFLKEVLFFRGMTIDQLRVLASVCEEEFFTEDTEIYKEGDPGGVLYVVVNGRVGIERHGRRKGSVARIDTIKAHAYFGDMNLFDDSPRTSSAIALEDTLTLSVHREPLIVLARQYPDLSLELINVLSQRLRQTTERIAEMTRTQPRELHKLFDQLEE
jgi:CRP-like cAMP-binding protein/HEAT repeat protein/ATP/ADP translocase